MIPFRTIRVGAAVAGVLMLAACGGDRSVAHRVLDERSEPLRSRFDADSGKVRALFLASPT